MRDSDVLEYGRTYHWTASLAIGHVAKESWGEYRPHRKGETVAQVRAGIHAHLAERAGTSPKLAPLARFQITS